MTAKRRIHFEVYKRLTSYTCAHPECESGISIEAHHVRPLSRGGYDAFWNIIALCWQCHHKRKLHSRSERVIVDLYVYKVMHELDKVGFAFDEKEDGFKERYLKALRDNKDIAEDERMVFSSLI